MSDPAGPPSHLVVGVGYTGRRVLSRLPRGSAMGLSRSVRADELPVCQIDLDRDNRLPVTPDTRYSLLYTAPPARDDSGDARLRRLLKLLPHAPSRVVYLSTSGVYGDRGGHVVSESAAPAPGSARARRRVAAENIVRTWCAEHGCDFVILRVPGIYGPGRLGIERIREGLPVLAECEANPGNRIHVDDLATCCLAALSADTEPGIYNVGDGDTRSSTWFAGEVARQLGVDPPPTVSRAEAERLFSARRLSFLNESRRLDLTRMRTSLVSRLEYADAADGIAASLEAAERAPGTGSR